MKGNRKIGRIVVPTPEIRTSNPGQSILNTLYLNRIQRTNEKEPRNGPFRNDVDDRK